ncbi:hypothetical protein R3P38DRAFT_2769921 [Favolaschia claudopus]|uniref:Uncharacterized protein n=1 Tax=Favolaschia claudopus TaxID=2862362 RepID=A0AAW0CL14_9AGAR
MSRINGKCGQSQYGLMAESDDGEPPPLCKNACARAAVAQNASLLSRSALAEQSRSCFALEVNGLISARAPLHLSRDQRLRSSRSRKQPTVVLSLGCQRSSSSFAADSPPTSSSASTVSFFKVREGKTWDNGDEAATNAAVHTGLDEWASGVKRERSWERRTVSFPYENHANSAAGAGEMGTRFNVARLGWVECDHTNMGRMPRKYDP